MYDVVWATMWILISLQDPEQYFEQFRTKDRLEYSVGYFYTQKDCEEAKKAMEKAVLYNAGYWLKGFTCKQEETLIPK